MQVLHESEEGPGPPEAGATGGCELLLGTGNQFVCSARAMCALNHQDIHPTCSKATFQRQRSIGLMFFSTY